MTPLKTHQPCPDTVNCGSSDAATVYPDGIYCFSCGKQFPNKEEEQMDDGTSTYQYLPWRGISDATMSFFDVKTRVASDGKPLEIGFPYGEGFIIRNMEQKKFRSVNMTKPCLFGIDKFEAGSARSITITEGATDALSVFEMMGRKYPTVSVRSASSAKVDCAAYRDKLNSFSRIYLCFDNDEPGRKALREVAQLFDFNKVYHVKLTKHKDANDFLTNKNQDEFKNAWYNAGRFLPEGIVSSFGDLFEALKSRRSEPGVPLPFSGLQEKLGGLRTGEIVCWKGLEGIGKSEVLKFIQYKLIKETDYNLGILNIEEGLADGVQGLAAYEIGAPIKDEELGYSDEQIFKAYTNLVRRDDRVNFFRYVGSDDPAVFLDTIRFMVTVLGCKFVFLDHITFTATGLRDEDQRQFLDYIATRSAQMVQELNFHLSWISHINEGGATRGSRTISHVSHTVVRLHRDLLSPSPTVRSTVCFDVEKNRPRRKTGPAGSAYFDDQQYTYLERPTTEELPV